MFGPQLVLGDILLQMLNICFHSQTQMGNLISNKVTQGDHTFPMMVYLATAKGKRIRESNGVHSNAIKLTRVNESFDSC